MFRINEAYEVLSHEEKRADYDNAYMLNGGSKIELVRSRVRRAKDIMLKDRSLITREEINLIESIIDYLDNNIQETSTEGAATSLAVRILRPRLCMEKLCATPRKRCF